MSPCSRCQIPHDLPAEGVLYLAPPLAHSTAQLGRTLRAERIGFADAAAGVLAVDLGPGQPLESVARVLASGLSDAERRDTRSLIRPREGAPSLADLMAMEPLGTLLAKLDGRWLARMIRDDALAVHFQPLVSGRDGLATEAHECLIRGVQADGSLVPPGRMYQCARDADMLFPLDKAARIACIRAAAAHRLDGLIFVNFHPSSIYDPVFCLRTTVAAVAEAGIAPDRVVFEVVESERAGVDLPRIFRFYRDAGFRVALDDLGAGFGSLNLLHELRPDFVKLDMELIRGVDLDPYKAAIASKLSEMARALGLRTVAEGVETPGEWDWVRSHDFDLAQGYYFARPASPPPSPARVDRLSA